MKKTSFSFSFAMRFLVVALSIVLFFACSSDEDNSSGGDEDLEAKVATKFMVGYGEANINPPVGEENGTIMGGFGTPGGTKRMTEIHDPLMAQAALFTNDADEAFMIISLDVTGYFYDFGDWGPGLKELREDISKNLADKITIKPEEILFASSHSHAATDMIGFWQLFGEGVDKDLIKMHQEQIGKAAKMAVESIQEAKVYFANTELAGYSGRDLDCSEVLDNTVSVIQVNDKDDKPWIVLTNYAKHPTFMEYNSTLGSADFIYGYREEMKKNMGVKAMYTQGFIAAVHDGEIEVPGVDGIERSYNMGKILSESVMSALEKKVESKEFDLKTRSTEFSCEAVDSYMNDIYIMFGMPKRAIEEKEDKLIVKQIPVSWHKLGSSEFAVFPGEGTAEYSKLLRTKIVSDNKFIIGLGNDCVGYILDHESLDADPSGQLDGYERKMGLGRPAGPCTWTAMESLGWFDGAYKE